MQLAIKLKGKTVAILLTAEPNKYVTFNGAALFYTDIGSIAVRQVRAGNTGSLQGS